MSCMLRKERELIQIKIDVEQMKSGRVAVELQTGLSKKRPPTESEENVASKLKGMIAVIVAEIASMCPGSSFAVGAEDVETLRGMENLEFEKGDSK